MLFFLHIPKTAGISVKSILAEYFPVSESLQFEFQPEVLHLSPLALRKHRLIMGHCTFALMEYVGVPYDVITFLRRPIDQAISMFFDLKENGVIDKEVTLRQMMDSTDVQRLINLQSRWLCSNDLGGENLGYFEHYPTRREAVTALTDPILFERASERLRNLRFVGITEHFSESVDLLCDEFAWPRTTRLVRLNARPEKNWSQIDQGALQDLTEMLEPDRKLYELGLQLFEEQRTRIRSECADSYPRRLCGLPRQREVHLDCEQKVFGTGWHERELTGQGRWSRWSGPTNSSTIELPLDQDADMELSFLALATITETGMEDLEVLVNGRNVELKHYFLDGGIYENAVYNARLPREVLGLQPGYTTIEFRTRETRRPSDYDPNSQDDRELGFKIDWVCLTAVASNGLRMNIRSRSEAAGVYSPR